MIIFTDDRGRMRLYDVQNALICIADEQDTLIVDISLCLSGYHTFPWLHEENTVVMAIGYLEKFEEMSTVRHEIFPKALL